MEIGQKIKKIRQFLDLGQVEFAESIGITHGALSKIENGRTEASVSTLKKIAELYKISLDWLIIDSGEPPKLFSWDKKAEASEKSGASAF